MSGPTFGSDFSEDLLAMLSDDIAAEIILRTAGEAPGTRIAVAYGALARIINRELPRESEATREARAACADALLKGVE